MLLGWGRHGFGLDPQNGGGALRQRLGRKFGPIALVAEPNVCEPNVVVPIVVVALVVVAKVADAVVANAKITEANVVAADVALAVRSALFGAGGDTLHGN